MIVVFLGLPGAGKGTYADLLAEKNWVKITMGDLLRDEIARKTALGLKAKRFMDKGKLVSDNITVQLVENHLKKIKKSQNIVLDGFPRDLGQTRELEKALKKTNRKLNWAIWINVPKSLVAERILNRQTCSNCHAIFGLDLQPKKKGICGKCGGTLTKRSDETPTIIKKRFKVFEQQTKPLLKHYQKQKLLEKVDGNDSIPIVFKRILAVLKKK